MELLEIKNTSQELFIEALKTLALPPKHAEPVPLKQAELTFAYKGINPSRGVYEGVSGCSKYFSDCKEQGIIPLNLSFTYDKDVNFFFPGKSELFLLSDDVFNTDETAKTKKECFIVGGKINMLSFEMYYRAERGLKTFLETELDKVLKQKYEFYTIDMVFSYSDEDDAKADTNMFYFGDSLDLKIGHCFEKKEIAKLTRWFKKLQKKYER